MKTILFAAIAAITLHQPALAGEGNGGGSLPANHGTTSVARAGTFDVGSELPPAGDLPGIMARAPYPFTETGSEQPFQGWALQGPFQSYAGRGSNWAPQMVRTTPGRTGKAGG